MTVAADMAGLAVGLRALHGAALAVLFGSLVFRLLVAPCPAWLIRRAGWIALLAGLGWLVAQAAVFAQADSLAALAGAIGPTVWETRFGRVLLARLLVLGVVLACPARGRGWAVVAALPAALALAAQPWLGHPGAEETAWQPALGILHILGAAAWIGGLPALASALRDRPEDTAVVARRFGWLGIGAVLALLVGGAGLAWDLAGPLPAWIGTAYGRLLLGKLALLAALLGIAARNRFVLGPRLAASTPARQALRRLVAVEIVLGLAALALAGGLATRLPGAHAQPDWPFPWRPSLAALEAPELRAEIGLALLGLGAGLAVALVVLIAFRRRFPALVLALCGLVWAWPTTELFVVPAWPTSYWQAPEPTAEDRARGAELFAARCASCHGASGHGDGPAARSLRVPPADLTAEHLWDHADGELFWWIAHGIRTQRGEVAMPGQRDLAEDDVWALIAHVRGFNPYAALYRRPGAHRH